MSKFLPVSLAPNLIGHSVSEQHFIKVLDSGKLHHSLLLTGASGIGKGAMAVRMAKVLLSGGVNDMFGGLSMDFLADDSFMARLCNGGHPDFMYLYLGMDSLKQKDKQCTDIPVDYIRRAKEFLHKTPAESKNRVLIIDDADTMNTNGANALLKILEEPSKNTYIILVTAKPNAMLPTIRSRCSVLNLKSFSTEQLELILSQRYPALGVEELKAYSKMADGSIGKAVSYIDNNVLPLYSIMVDAMVKNSDAVYSLASSVTGKANEKSYAVFSDLLNGWLGRLAISSVKSGGVMDCVINSEQQAYNKITTKFAKLKLMEWIDMVKKNVDSVNPPRYMDKKTVILTTFLSLHDGL